jgi:hypothetical protein
MQTLFSTLLVLCGLVGFGSPVPISQYADLVPSGFLLDPDIFQALDEIAAARSHYQQNRLLQQDPIALCDMFNAAADGILDCTCSRYDKRDTRLSCDYVNTTCNADASICFNATVDIIVDLDAKSKSVTQCTYSIKELNETATDTCITVYPAALGNYTELDSCCTTLNGDECNFCYISDTPDLAFSPIAVTYDCCNVVTDIKGTDNPVGANGAAFATFDAIAAGEEGECKGNNNPPSGKSEGVCISFGGDAGDGGDDDDDGGSGATDGQSGGMTLVVAAMTVIALVGAGWF